MSNDIVKRLRDASYGPQHIMKEAAAHIEDLEDQVASLRVDLDWHTKTLDSIRETLN